ncbi:DUF6112 family protein [Georgenia yuyongxinii]
MIRQEAVGPDFDAVATTGQLSQIIGALLTIGLLTAVGMLIVCAIAWAIATASGSWHGANRARTGVLVAIGGAALTGGALAWTNWLLHTGSTL